MQNELLNHNWLRKQIELIKLGLEFPFNSTNGILLTNVDKERAEKMKKEAIKEEVLKKIIRMSKEWYVSPEVMDFVKKEWKLKKVKKKF